jgi:hypothetical protein
MHASSVRTAALIAIALLGVCAGSGCSPEGMLDVPAISADSMAALEIAEPGTDGSFMTMPLATPDGSGQTVHPDYAMMPVWLPRRYLVATPYTYSDSLVENPSLFAQTLGFSWEAYGLGNPIVRRKTGYLSDPDIVALPDRGELWVYYREVTSRNRIWLIRSSDGVGWSDPVRVVTARNHRVISPAVVRRAANSWLMWSVNAGRDGCSSQATYVEIRRSTDGVHWSQPQIVNLAQTPFFVWHIDVQWIPDREEFWALYNVKGAGSCNTQLLFLATSPDGVRWKTYPSPVLRIGAIREFSDIVYRSTFAYNARTDNIRFWFSGAGHDARGFVWRTVYQRRRRADVFASIAREGSPPPAAAAHALINPP